MGVERLTRTVLSVAVEIIEDQRTGPVQLSLVGQNVHPGQPLGIKAHKGDLVLHVEAEIVSRSTVAGVNQQGGEPLRRGAGSRRKRGGREGVPAV